MGNKTHDLLIADHELGVGYTQAHVSTTETCACVYPTLYAKSTFSSFFPKHDDIFRSFEHGWLGDAGDSGESGTWGIVGPLANRR